MAKGAKKKVNATPAGDLTTLQIKDISDLLVKLREKNTQHRRNSLDPTAEWDRLRKEIASLNKLLNADAKVKTKRSKEPESE